MKLTRGLVAVAGVLALATALGACSGKSDEPASPSHSEQATAGRYTGPVPNFSGPWAAGFADSYRSTTSSLVHEILADGSITDQEYATVANNYVTCMKSKGFTARIDGPAGQATVSGGPPGGDTNAADMACSDDMSVIGALRSELLRNPQNLDENTIMAACLVKKKLVSPTYTANDYARDLETMTFPFNTSSSAFGTCTSDPLGLASGSG